MSQENEVKISSEKIPDGATPTEPVFLKGLVQTTEAENKGGPIYEEEKFKLSKDKSLKDSLEDSDLSKEISESSSIEDQLTVPIASRIFNSMMKKKSKQVSPTLEKRKKKKRKLANKSRRNNRRKK